MAPACRTIQTAVVPTRPAGARRADLADLQQSQQTNQQSNQQRIQQPSGQPSTGSTSSDGLTQHQMVDAAALAVLVPVALAWTADSGAEVAG